MYINSAGVFAGFNLFIRVRGELFVFCDGFVMLPHDQNAILNFLVYFHYSLKKRCPVENRVTACG